MGKVLFSEVDYTRYNTLYTLENETKEEVSEKVADAVMEEYEKVIFARTIKDYSYLESFEREEILKICNRISKEGDASFPSFEERRKIVQSAVFEYLRGEEEIIPCGFVDFRLRELYSYGAQIVKKATDIYFDEQEYEEFIRLLKLFLDTREAKEEVLHLVIDESIRLINKRGVDVTEKYERDFYTTAHNKGATDEDLAISAVLAAAPKKLVIHTDKETLLVKNLKNIFSNRCIMVKKD